MLLLTCKSRYAWMYAEAVRKVAAEIARGELPELMQDNIDGTSIIVVASPQDSFASVMHFVMDAGKQQRDAARRSA